MIDALYWSAALLALAGVRKDNRTALPLLASAAFCAVARWQDIPFNRPLWIAVDVAVIAAIAWPLVPFIRTRAWRWVLAFRKELAILAMFVPMFAAYAMPQGLAHLVSTAAGTVQFLLTVPYADFFERWKDNLRRRHSWSRFDLREAYA